MAMTPMGILISRIWFRIRVVNKDVLWSYSNRGCFLISNHVFYLDPLIILYTLYPAKPVFSVLEKTMRVKYLGAFLRLMGCFTISKKNAMSELTSAINALLQQWRFVHFFPEGNLRRGSQQMLRFRKGVFRLAYQSNKPVIPMTLVLRKRTLGKYQLSFLPQRIDVIIGSPIDPSNYKQSDACDFDKHQKRKIVNAMCQDASDQMQKVLEGDIT